MDATQSRSKSTKRKPNTSSSPATPPKDLERLWYPDDMAREALKECRADFMYGRMPSGLRGLAVCGADDPGKIPWAKLVPEGSVPQPLGQARPFDRSLAVAIYGRECDLEAAKTFIKLSQDTLVALRDSGWPLLDPEWRRCSHGLWLAYVFEIAQRYGGTEEPRHFAAAKFSNTIKSRGVSDALWPVDHDDPPARENPWLEGHWMPGPPGSSTPQVWAEGATLLFPHDRVCLLNADICKCSAEVLAYMLRELDTEIRRERAQAQGTDGEGGANTEGQGGLVGDEGEAGSAERTVHPEVGEDREVQQPEQGGSDGVALQGPGKYARQRRWERRNRERVRAATRERVRRHRQRRRDDG